MSLDDGLVDDQMKLGVECSEIVEGYCPRNRFGGQENQCVIERTCDDSM